LTFSIFWQNKEHFKKFMDSLMKNATKLKLLKKDLAKSFTKASTEK